MSERTGLEAVAAELLALWTDGTGGVRRGDSEAALRLADYVTARLAAAWWSGHLNACEDTERLKSDDHQAMHQPLNPYPADPTTDESDR